MSNALLNAIQRKDFLDRLMEAMVGRPELSPMGWIIQEEPAEKWLHLEEYTLQTDALDEFRYLLALVVHDKVGETVGCFPVTDDLIRLQPNGLRSALRQVCNAPNGALRSDKPIHLTNPVPGSVCDRAELEPDAQKVAFYVEAMLRRKERLGVVITQTWEQALELIRTLRPWTTQLPTHWWERSRRNEVRLNVFSGPEKLTLVFLPWDVQLHLDRCLRPDSCLQLVGQIGADVTNLLQRSRRTITTVDSVYVRGYRKNVTHEDSPSLPRPG